MVKQELERPSLWMDRRQTSNTEVWFQDQSIKFSKKSALFTTKKSRFLFLIWKSITSSSLIYSRMSQETLMEDQLSAFKTTQKVKCMWKALLSRQLQMKSKRLTSFSKVKQRRLLLPQKWTNNLVEHTLFTRFTSRASRELNLLRRLFTPNCTWLI